jgi:hypothetical protein
MMGTSKVAPKEHISIEKSDNSIQYMGYMSNIYCRPHIALTDQFVIQIQGPLNPCCYVSWVEGVGKGIQNDEREIRKVVRDEDTKKWSTLKLNGTLPLIFT